MQKVTSQLSVSKASYNNSAYSTHSAECCYLIAVPHALQRGILAAPNTAGRLLASPILPTRIFLGPVGILGCHVPGIGAGAATAGGGGTG